ncbi:HEAT repeat-containing protein [Parelusimicrobium proximum]|uniref:HEAT repeat domain-containing protein n=1 Tax=Parelusimicrobium proximum TaxID=3228953 RepID=UPI003D17CD44
MKNIIKLLSFILISFICLSQAFAETVITEELKSALPLLQKQNKTMTDVENILNLFLSSRDEDVVFAAGAALASAPPTGASEGRLLNVLISSDDGLKKIFASVILTAMGRSYPELNIILEEGIKSKDNILHGYSCASYIIINGHKPEQKDCVYYALGLFPYDKTFALSSLMSVYKKNESVYNFVRKAGSYDSAFVRAAAAQMMGDSGTEKDLDTLAKMLKKEKDPEVLGAVAQGLAKYPIRAVKESAKCLDAKADTEYALGCTLMLGLIPAEGMGVIESGLTDKKANVRANSARSASVMANMLSGPSAAVYSNDVEFDKEMLKYMIPKIITMSKYDTDAAARKHAETALKEMYKVLPELN